MCKLVLVKGRLMGVARVCFLWSLWTSSNFALKGARHLYISTGPWQLLSSIQHLSESQSLHRPSHSSAGPTLATRALSPKMDSSPSTLRIMARGTYRTVIPTGLHPGPATHLPPKSGVYALSAGPRPGVMKRTTIIARPVLVHTRRNSCPVRKYWQRGRNFGKIGWVFAPNHKPSAGNNQ